MMSGHDQNLSEVVNITDVAVRTASQLRLLKAGKTLADRNALELAIQFLTRAKDGGTFITRKSSSLQHSLKPFNWATDTYIELHPPSKPDYERVATYLEQIFKALRSALEAQTATDAEQLELVAAFFSKLGEVLGSRADKILFEVSEVSNRRL
jgi:hypothetical protein